MNIWSIYLQDNQQHKHHTSYDGDGIITFIHIIIIVIMMIMFMIIIKLIMAPVELSDNSAKSKQSNNFESTEQRSDTLQDVKLFYK